MLRLGIAVLTVPFALLPLACGPADSPGLVRAYVPRNAHQAYGHSLAQTRLAQSALGRDWLAAAERALAEPADVGLPHTVSLSADAGRPSAWGYRFTGRAGQRLAVEVQARADERLETFIDLFLVGAKRIEHVASAPPLPRDADREPVRRIEWQVLQERQYVLRIQPELLRSGTIDVAIRALPLLAFPVSGLGMPAIQSGFGAERDGGVRAHRGVDVFAPRGTAAVASVDAWVSRVDTTRRGGNVVWLQPLFGDLRLYYAHLDAQFVEPGQFVRAGEVIGTVGNTGNASTTPPHLHFGVYLRRRGMRGGATDPIHFLH
jgi:murein DD-endopeptidase MepM/ murein hydrolase activator NlpD